MRGCQVSVLFNEPKLLKFKQRRVAAIGHTVSVLFNEPKLLKCPSPPRRPSTISPVSVLFNEPKLLKSLSAALVPSTQTACFSALQRAEIAEIFRL